MLATSCSGCSDDGIGFDPHSVQPARGHGLGLVGMRERVATVGGTLTVESQPGKGTRIEARIPGPQRQNCRNGNMSKVRVLLSTTTWSSASASKR